MPATIVLHAEDDPNEAFLLARAFKRADGRYNLQHVPDGQAAIEYLSGAGAFEDREKFPLPAVLLLDLKMPRKDGFEVLKWVRATGPFAQLPVVVLTSSEQPEDQKRASDLGASAYLTKSLDWARVLNMVDKLVG